MTEQRADLDDRARTVGLADQLPQEPRLVNADLAVRAEDLEDPEVPDAEALVRSEHRLLLAPVTHEFGVCRAQQGLDPTFHSHLSLAGPAGFWLTAAAHGRGPDPGPHSVPAPPESQAGRGG